jgi:hypothetical protein
MPSPLRRLGAQASLTEIGSLNMTKTQSLLIAALLSSVAAVSFAQAPAAPAVANVPVATATPAAAMAPVGTAVKPAHKKHHRHHAKRAVTTAPAAATAAPAVMK